MLLCFLLLSPLISMICWCPWTQSTGVY
jgi:hypothetical protein